MKQSVQRLHGEVDANYIVKLVCTRGGGGHCLHPQALSKATPQMVEFMHHCMLQLVWLHATLVLPNEAQPIMDNIQNRNAKPRQLTLVGMLVPLFLNGCIYLSCIWQDFVSS